MTRSKGGIEALYVKNEAEYALLVTYLGSVVALFRRAGRPGSDILRNLGHISREDTREPTHADLPTFEFGEPDKSFKTVEVAAAIGAGTVRPLMTIVFGSLVNDFNSSGTVLFSLEITRQLQLVKNGLPETLRIAAVQSLFKLCNSVYYSLHTKLEVNTGHVLNRELQSPVKEAHRKAVMFMALFAFSQIASLLGEFESSMMFTFETKTANGNPEMASV
ncbi:hypothetical protein SBOR_1170 [Sclerotinia borealis F-4128]|uniref:Uncharacterized protein n=1 Tax=Sclerotinia borealis (strain F-4128) TaxID=1432307 RepID=W9CR03_SCLBF|nr:hypothetical protein SBOR_1170 [Sclerotinia borealis F-4128]